jgi:hypothetical protein
VRNVVKEIRFCPVPVSTDLNRSDVQVFSGEGELLQIIGPKGDIKVAFEAEIEGDTIVFGVAARADGRMFVVDMTANVILLS